MKLSESFFKKYDVFLYNVATNNALRHNNSARVGDGCRQKLCI